MKYLTIFSMLVFSVLFVSMASALVCDRTSLDNTYTSVSCSDYSNQTISVNPVGLYYSVSPNTLSYSNQLKTFNVTIDSSAPIGNLGALIFSTSNQTISIPITNNITTQTTCQLNPSLVSYTQAIQQGSTLTLPKITFNPLNCGGSLVLTASSVSVQGGIVTTSGQKPVSIQSVQSDGIILNIDTSGLNSQTYVSYLTINAFNKQFQIPFSITVTTGTSPGTSFDPANLPTCTVSSTTLSLNSTYQLICTSIQPDITINPVVDTNYIIGTGLDTTSNQYIWKFSPVKLGNTVIKANFNYRNSPVGNPYSQEVKISSTGSTIAGTNLKLSFTPDLAQASPDSLVIVQVIDNKTNNLIDAQILVDAVPLVANNSIYYFQFQASKNYTFRAKASGYDDLVQTIYLPNLPINLSVNPSSGDTSTMFKILDGGINSTLYLDGKAVGNPFYSTLPQGSHLIRAEKSGYLPKEINFTVEVSPSVSLSTEFKKGTKQIATLSKPLNWTVNYMPDLLSPKTMVTSGEGSNVEFTPKQVGIYTIESNGNTLSTYEIKNNTFKIFGIAWYWILLALIVIIAIYSISKNKGQQEGLFAGSTNIGGG